MRSQRKALIQFEKVVNEIKQFSLYLILEENEKERFNKSMDMVRKDIERDEKVVHYDKGAIWYITQTLGKNEYQLHHHPIVTELYAPAELSDGIKLTGKQFEALIRIAHAASQACYTVDGVHLEAYMKQVEQLVSDMIAGMLKK